MSQKQRLLEHLQSGETIDRLRALNKLGIFELSARIIDLEEMGYRVNKNRKNITNRWGENCRVVEYSLNIGINIWSPNNEKI